MPATPRSALLLIMCSSLPAAAQMIEVPSAKNTTTGHKVEGLDSSEHASFAADRSLSGVYQLPSVRKAQADLSETAPVYVNQDALTLNDKRFAGRKTENVLDLSVLKEPSVYRTASRVRMQVSDQQATGIHAGLAEISAAYQKPGQKSDNADCESVSMSVEHRIQMDTSKVLEIVESEIGANANCACEIVKIAIKASGADEGLVGDITEVAITSAPQSMRMISQCAIAAMPEALPAVQAVLAKLDPNRGDTSYSAKDAKSGKEAVAAAVSPPEEPPNPLDLPPPLFPPLPPPPVYPPPEVTDPNP
ncbi:hypothetical protein ACFSSA_06895 [Luteolibacter algae]|uniref:Uncharacterized protein n=1 Tax=Luteolibacter algae TaxID=454151 RepID=A0ABW5D736_9BACT